MMNDIHPAMIELTQRQTGDNLAVIQTTNLPILPIHPAANPEQALKSSWYGHGNLGLHVGDDSVTVHDNRSRLLNLLQTKFPTLTRINWLSQVHGDSVYHVTKELTAEAVAADAQITTLPNVALAIMTADCVPIMLASDSADLASQANRVIAAVHAGWQGIAKNIIRHTVQKMVHQFDFIDTNTASTEMQLVTQGWQAWIGASIAQANYEVDAKVRIAVLQALQELDINIHPDMIFRPNPARDGHYFADLPKIAELQLNACGIYQVHQSHLDSFSDARFYSYRQQTQNQLPATGRMATLIFMR